MLLSGSELAQLPAGSCQPPELVEARKSPGTSHAVAVGSPGTWQHENKQHYFQLVLPLGTVIAKAAFKLGLSPAAYRLQPGLEAGEGTSRWEEAGRRLGASRAGSEHSALRTLQPRGLAPVSVLFAQVQLE